MAFYFSLFIFAIFTLCVDSATTTYSELGPLTRINEGIADGDKHPLVALKVDQNSTSNPTSSSIPHSTPSPSSSSSSSSGNQVTAPPDLPLPSNFGGSGVPEVPGGGNQLSSIPNPISGLIGAIQLARTLTQQTIGQITLLLTQINQYASRIVSG